MKMQNESFLRHLNNLFDAIETCIAKNLELPSLILIYPAIDIDGWLAAPQVETTVRENFTRWVDHYINPKKNFDCSSLDFYSARYTILHTYSPDSRLTKKGEAKQIAYAWGDASLEDLKTAIKRSGWTYLHAVHLTDLYRVYRDGMIRFLDEVEHNPKLAPLFEERSGNVFALLSKGEIKEYIESLEHNDSVT